MSSSSWLITGANRGIGFGIVSALAQRPNTTIIAAVRDPNSANDLHGLAQKAANGSKIVVVKISSTSETDAKAAVEELKQQGIHKLDVVIANAGIVNYYGPIVTTPIDQLRDHFEVNTLGFIILFQAIWPLLEQSKDPKFVYISSPAGSIGAGLPIPAAAYGASKAAGNYLTAKIHQEHPSLTAFAISPGVVQTDMGNAGVKVLASILPSLTDRAVTVDKSVAGILDRVDAATRENSGGKFKDFQVQDDWAW